MKNLLLIFSLLISSNCIIRKQVSNETFYIYVKPGDPLFFKTIHKDGISIKYLCHCYARKDNLEFTNTDKNQINNRDTLAVNHISMREFAAIANNRRDKSKPNDLWNANIYIIEKGGLKYTYCKVRFYGIENDE